MRGLQPFYRGLYLLASRESRTAAAVGSRVEFCGTPTSAKVRNDRPVCVSLPTRRHLSCLQVRCGQQLCPPRMLWQGREKRSDTGRSGTKNAVFPAQKKAQKKHICGSPNTAWADAGGLFVPLKSLWLSVMVSVDGGGLYVGDENNNNNNN